MMRINDRVSGVSIISDDWSSRNSSTRERHSPEREPPRHSGFIVINHGAFDDVKRVPALGH
jgi:hypothetical protein